MDSSFYYRMYSNDDAIGRAGTGIMKKSETSGSRLALNSQT
jgi:hypothetical protein